MEQWFEGLDRHSQIGRLRRVATTALAAYDLPAARLTLLAHRYNTTFRVDTAGGQRYVLRINRAGSPTVESVGAELAWLAALRRDTTLQVPDPVPTRAGPLLTVASTPDMPRSHICVVFRWLDGRRLTAGLAPVHLERAGELMARLQDHAARFGPPPGFPRGRVDGLTTAARTSEMNSRNKPLALTEISRQPLSGAKGNGEEGPFDPFAPSAIAACQALVAGALSVEEAAQVTAVLERVLAAQRALGQDPATFGLIHADLHHYNLLFTRGIVRAIDFDDCGFGPLLYDLAVPLAQLQGRAEYPALRAGLLAGYRRVRRLPAEHEAYLDTFIALRRVQDALWVLEARQHPAIGPDWAAEARETLAPLSTFLAGGGVY